MWAYILRKLIIYIPVYLSVILVLMGLLRLRDPVYAYLGKNADEVRGAARNAAGDPTAPSNQRGSSSCGPSHGHANGGGRNDLVYKVPKFQKTSAHSVFNHQIRPIARDEPHHTRDHHRRISNEP